jgi:hypothetical protein
MGLAVAIVRLTKRESMRQWLSVGSAWRRIRNGAELEPNTKNGSGGLH